MVPPRSVLIPILLALLSAPPTRAQQPVVEAPPEVQRAPLDRRPYAIEADFLVGQGVRLDARGRSELESAWLDLVHRFIGAPWELSVNQGPTPLAGSPLEGLTPTDFPVRDSAPDRIWAIRLDAAPSGWTVSGRSFDPSTGQLGAVCTRPAPYPADAARALFDLSLDLFSPSADVGELSGGAVTITVQGAALPPSSPLGLVVQPGSVFRLIRIFQKPDGSTLRVVEVPLSYLSVSEVEGPVARCQIVSRLSDPITRMVGRRNVVVARGVRPTANSTLLRFVAGPDRRPAAGYQLSARKWPDGPSREVGITGRDGSIEIPGGFIDGLMMLRLVAGGTEPMVEFPAMPGETAAVRTIPFLDRPETVALQAQVDALRDSILDVVARRKLLERRLEARVEGKDWPDVRATLDAFHKLPPAATFSEQLAQLREDAASRQEKSRTPILTKTAQARLAEVQAIIDGYLDDRVFLDFEETYQQSQSRPAEAKAEIRPITPIPGAGATAPIAPARPKTGSPGTPF